MKLVLGTPDPVAQRFIARLISRGERVATVCGSDLAGQLPDGVQLIPGDAASIDFGLSGESYLRLATEVTQLVLCDATPISSGDVERSRSVRQAAEVVEFVKAGGAPDGVTFLSSLLVFGSASGVVSEDELRLGQSFSDEYEESLAIAEKLIQGLVGQCPIAIVRVSPIAGSEESGEMIPGSALAQLARTLKSSREDRGYVFSDLPVRFETVERAVLALERVQPRQTPLVVHLADAEPISDRELIEWLANRLNKSIHESPAGTRPWAYFAKSKYPGSRALSGWGLRFNRAHAEATIPELLDRDDWTTLEKLFPRSEAA